MRRLLPILLLSLLSPANGDAWDLFGHHVIGAVAWEHMDPAARERAVALLLEAPPDAGLAALLPPNHRAFEARSRELFVKAGGWADLVRDELWPERKERYDRPAWHYVNRFWRSTVEGPEPIDAMGTIGELVERLEEAKAIVADPSRPEAKRAVSLAWLLHLTGDVHQPLHSSGRVTEADPEGDRGGNDFALEDPEAGNLHYYWDSVLRRSRRRSHSEGYFRWVGRVASELTAAHPTSSLAKELDASSPEHWSRAGAEIAMRSAYPEGLVRGAAPPRWYRERAFEIAARQAALAGYRLARILNGTLADPP